MNEWMSEWTRAIDERRDEKWKLEKKNERKLMHNFIDDENDNHVPKCLNIQ